MSLAQPGSNVVVLGATPKEDRFAFKATKRLKSHGFVTIPIHPAGHVVDGDTALKSLDEITVPVDTLTVYVGPKISNGELKRIQRLEPRRVIFNPGAENLALADKLEEFGFEVVNACTLVMLDSDLF